MEIGSRTVKVAPSPGRLSMVSAAAMPVHDVLDQRETQAGAALRAAFGDIDPVEALGQPRQMLGGDARPVVAHRDQRLLAAADR